MRLDPNGKIDQAISGQCILDLTALSELRDLGIKAQFPASVKKYMNNICMHEKDWSAFLKHAEEKANRLILGWDGSEGKHAPRRRGFHLVENQNAYNRYMLVFDLHRGPTGLTRYPELAAKARDGIIFGHHIEDFYNKLAKRLGVLPIISYDSYHVGGHGAIDEERIAIPFRSAEDLVLKLHQLESDPALLAKSQIFVRRVLWDVVAEFVMPYNSPEFVAELLERCPWSFNMSAEERESYTEKSRAIKAELEQRPENIIWADLRERTRQDPTATIGDLLRHLRNPGDDELTRKVYARILATIEEMLPVLATRQRLTVTSRPQLLAPGATPILPPSPL